MMDMLHMAQCLQSNLLFNKVLQFQVNYIIKLIRMRYDHIRRLIKWKYAYESLSA